MTEPEIETLTSQLCSFSFPVNEERFELPIGIDISSWPCCVAVWNFSKSNVDLFSNTANQNLMKSCKMFRHDGSPIEDQECDMVFETTVYKMRRLIGRIDTDPLVVHATRFPPFVVHTLGIGVRPLVLTMGDKVLKYTTAERVLGSYLYQLRVLAETQLKRPVRNVVLTVPVSFNRFQLAHMKDACVMAGFRVIRLMPQPTAVAFLYAQQQLTASSTSREDMDSEIEKIALIFNMDSGNCDVAITAVTAGGTCKMKALVGSDIGEEDLVGNMVCHLVPDSKTIFHENCDVDEVHKATCLLRVEILKVIHELSSQASVEFDLDLGDGLKICKVVTREEFEEVNRGVFEICERLIKRCLHDADVKAENLNDVIIVGTCYNIPRVKNLVCEICKGKCIKFTGKELYDGINPLEFALCGAAVAGAVDSVFSDRSGKLDLFTSQSRVTPLSIGIRADGNKFVPVIPRYTLFPAYEWIYFTTIHDNQTEALILVYEGDVEKAEENHFLGYLKITGIPAVPKGDPHINVGMAIDLENNLRVIVSVYMPGSQQPVIPAMEARMPMPVFDDVHGLIVEELNKTYGNTMDLVTLPIKFDNGQCSMTGVE